MNSEKELWLDEIGVCREVGIFEGEDRGERSSGRIGHVTFKAGLFDFEVYYDKLIDEFGVLWRINGSGVVVPDPIEALFYFCSDAEALTVDDGAVGAIGSRLRQSLLVLSTNNWILRSLDWVDDAGFKRAWEAANDWARQQNRLMRPWEFERRIAVEKQRLAEAGDLSME